MFSSSRSACARHVSSPDKHREPHQILRRHRIGIRRRVVGGRMRPQQQIAGVVRRPVIAAGLSVGVMRIERALPRQRLVEKALLAGRLEQRERGADHRGEVGRQSGKQQLPVAPRMTETVALGHRRGDEIEGAPRHGEP